MQVGTPEPFFTRIQLSTGEETSGTLSIYISTPDGAGDFEYLDTDGSALTATRTAWKTGLTHDADDGFGAWLTVPASLDDKAVFIEYEHSTHGFVADESDFAAQGGAGSSGGGHGLTVDLRP